MNFKLVFGVLIIGIMLLLIPGDVLSQCPMCKTNLEGAMQKEGNTVGAGINEGIMYLFVMPFICVGVVAYLWYRQSRLSLNNV